MLNNDDYEKVLKGNQGTVIKDFNALLNFIEKKGGVVLTKSETAFNMSDLPSINEICSKPQKTGLARPQQKAFPYINSLFLLLRLSLLGDVKKEKNKSVIHIDPVAQNSWKQLKPVEQYGHLLTYLLHPAANVIIGESYNPLMEKISWLYNDKKGLLEYINSKKYYSIPDYQIAVLDLFGIFSVKHLTPKPGKAWDFKSVSLTRYGEAIIKYISTLRHQAFGLYSMDTLLSIMQPLFPDWKTFIKVPQKNPEFGVHVFRISLGKVWRQIAIKGEMNLHSFGDVILEAFEFDNDHLHEFSYKNKRGLIEKISHYECGEDFSSDEILLGELNLQIGSEIFFLFDFGDSWRFHIVLEELNPEGLKVEKPVVLKKYGESPSQYEYENDFDDLDSFEEDEEK